MIEFASGEGENRIGGLLGNENGIGLFLANGILCCVVFFIKNKKLIIRILTAISTFLLGAMLLFTGSRKSLVFALFAGTKNALPAIFFCADYWAVKYYLNLPQSGV
jgi:hypothetical protein